MILCHLEKPLMKSEVSFHCFDRFNIVNYDFNLIVMPFAN